MSSYTNAWPPSNYKQFIVIVIIIIIIILISAFPSVEINANYFPTNPVSALLIVAHYVWAQTQFNPDQIITPSFDNNFLQTICGLSVLSTLGGYLQHH